MRKWTYLVATLLMAGTTATFTGCIDTDEPEGIAELRGAKSDFIKAQAAVELVEAELRKAQVAEQELVNAGLSASAFAMSASASAFACAVAASSFSIRSCFN